MAKNTSVTLGDHFDQFIDSQIAEGRYGSASEIERAGLRLLEVEEMKVEALRKSLIEGEKRGVSTRSMEDIFSAVKRCHKADNG